MCMWGSMEHERGLDRRRKDASARSSIPRQQSSSRSSGLVGRYARAPEWRSCPTYRTGQGVRSAWFKTNADRCRRHTTLTVTIELLVLPVCWAPAARLARLPPSSSVLGSRLMWHHTVTSYSLSTCPSSVPGMHMFHPVIQALSAPHHGQCHREEKSTVNVTRKGRSRRLPRHILVAYARVRACDYRIDLHRASGFSLRWHQASGLT